MEIPSQLRCLFAAEVEPEGDTYRVQIPAQEVDLGSVEVGETYRVAVLPAADGIDDSATSARADHDQEASPPAPPVEEGERREVEITAIGEQGDGIAHVDRGFVVIVPETHQGDRVTVEITEVRDTVAFAEVEERHDYFE